MLKDIQWYNIATRLRNFLKSYRHKSGNRVFNYLVDREDMKIRVGSGNTGEYPALWILFGDESELDHQDDIVGATVQLWLDLYVKAEATPEYDFTNNLYDQLFKAEQELVYENNKMGLTISIGVSSAIFFIAVTISSLPP